MAELATKEIISNLNHYLIMYAINQDEQYIAGVITFAGLLAGRVTK